MKELNLLRELVSKQPYLQMLGLEVLDAGPGWTKERLPFKPEFLQPYVLHGGVIYSLADTLAAHVYLRRPLRKNEALIVTPVPPQSPS